jgi:death-on-curing family protein
MKTNFLNAEQVLSIHYELARFFAESGDPISPAGVKHEHLFHSAIYRPQTSFGEVEKYPTIDRKAAALLHSLIKNHVFHNGNKRTALVSLLVFLDNHDIRIDAPDDELFSFIISIAKDTLVPDSQDSDTIVEAINKWLRQHSSKISNTSTGMSVKDFLEAVQKTGGQYRKKNNGSWTVRGLNNNSVLISGSTRTLSGKIVKSYLVKLGMSTGQTGFYFEEFKEGITSQQKFIIEFRSVLKRLADA